MARSKGSNPAPSMPGVNTTPYLDIHELSARTGWSVATIHRLKARGQIPFFQPAGKGGKLLFPADAVERTASFPAFREPAASPLAPPQGQLSGPSPAWMRASITKIKESSHAT